MAVTVAVRAVGAAAVLGAGQFGLAEWLGITRFREGYCCGFERILLPAHSNLVWYGATAAYLATLLTLRSGAVTTERLAPAQRAWTALYAWVGSAAAGVGVLAYLERLAPTPGANLSSSQVLRAWAAGTVIGLLVSVVAVAPAVYGSPVPLALLATTGVYWLAAILAATVGSGLVRVPPGGIPLGRVASSALPLIAMGLAFGLVTARAALGGPTSMGRWRRSVAFAAGWVLLAVLIWATYEVVPVADDLAPRLLGDIPFLSTGAYYGLLGTGVAIGLRRHAGSWYWLAPTAVAGFVPVVSAVSVTAAELGHQYGGGAGPVTTTYDVAVGLLVALAGGVVAGGLRGRSAHPTHGIRAP